MSSTSKLPGYYAFDIERTGPTNDDLTFGFGAAFSDKNGSITKGNVCLKL